MSMTCSVSNGRRAMTALLPSFVFLSATVLSATAALASPPAVLTQHNDNLRTGANPSETSLTPANVNVSGFGKLFTRTLDANVNGQVLYVPNITINGAVHNVIYAYTSNNSNGSPCSVWAFDADDPNASTALWRRQLPASAQWTTATPVIDPASNTMYVLTKDTNDNGPTRLRALDITTGNEKPGSPITIAATVNGTGDGSSGGKVSFDTTHANCRPGLLFLNGVVYIAFAHNSDSFPYHGWVFGYSYNGSSFTQTAVFCTDPNGGESGVWMAGKGLMADANNYLYCATGNGTFDANAGGTEYGMTYLKLSTPGLSVADWFTPYDQQGNSNSDLDLGNSGILGIPGTDRVFGGGTKFGSVFLLDSSNMGKFTSGGPDKAVQRFDHVMSNDNVGQNAICWDAGAYKYVYLWPSGANLLQYRYDPNAPNSITGTNGQFNPAGVNTQAPLNNGGSLAITAHGGGNGILWAVGNNGVVHALNATDLTQPELWNSNQNSGRDSLGSVGHFQFPTAVNGKVYVPTGSASIVAYGLLTAAQTLAPTANAFVRAGSYAGVNYGNGPDLASAKVTNDSTNNSNIGAYLKFDLTGVKTAPSRATLQLTANSYSTPASSTENLQINYVTDTSWTETGITWNNAPGLNRTNFTSSGTLVKTKVVSLTPGLISIDLTAFVANHIGQVVTLQLMDATAEGVGLVVNSREDSSGSPALALAP
jgi:hypothetical protein